MYYQMLANPFFVRWLNSEYKLMGGSWFLLFRGGLGKFVWSTNLLFNIFFCIDLYLLHFQERVDSWALHLVHWIIGLVRLKFSVFG